MGEMCCRGRATSAAGGWEEGGIWEGMGGVRRGAFLVTCDYSLRADEWAKYTVTLYEKSGRIQDPVKNLQ